MNKERGKFQVKEVIIIISLRKWNVNGYLKEVNRGNIGVKSGRTQAWIGSGKKIKTGFGANFYKEVPVPVIARVAFI